jgi:hypothetical protein
MLLTVPRNKKGKKETQERHGKKEKTKQKIPCPYLEMTPDHPGRRHHFVTEISQFI